jgi:hypothetical protein
MVAASVSVLRCRAFKLIIMCVIRILYSLMPQEGVKII